MFRPATAAASPSVDFSPVTLVIEASGPVAVVLWILITAAGAVWLITVLKLLQLRRWRRAAVRFDAALREPRGAAELRRICQQHDQALGADVLLTMLEGPRDDKSLTTAADEALLVVTDRVESMMSLLSTIGAASPFVGLLGTVYGILEAFLRIGREKSATLPVVAPAIGEALIATAIGLFAAIPAMVAYNALSKRTDAVLARLHARSRRWAAGIQRSDAVGEGGP